MHTDTQTHTHTHALTIKHSIGDGQIEAMLQDYLQDPLAVAAAAQAEREMAAAAAAPNPGAILRPGANRKDGSKVRPRGHTLSPQSMAATPTDAARHSYTRACKHA
jgi:hypothetical protein